MSTIDRQRVAAVRKLEAMGYTFAAGDWMQPANDAVAPVITDALHALLVRRADALVSCTEGSDEEAELAYKANKASNGNGGLKWIQKGGGYYSECNKRLKS
jgi:hypothetical protein